MPPVADVLKEACMFIAHGLNPTDEQRAEAGDFYKCLQASTGNAPTETAYWERLTVPYRFLDYCVYSSYADWLRQDDQHAKAEGIARLAENILLTEQERLERQEGFIKPPVVTTHLNSFDNISTRTSTILQAVTVDCTTQTPQHKPGSGFVFTVLLTVHLLR